MITVVMPIRDASATLSEAIESVLAEGAVGELICVDDGSLDASTTIARDFVARDRRVRLVASSSAGVARALCRGVDAARGELIARMDADDISIVGRITKQADALERDGSIAAIGSMITAFPSPGAGLTAYVEWQNALVTPEQIARAVFVEAPLCHPSVTLRRSALDAIGGYADAPWPEDYDLWLRFVTRGYALGKLPEVLLKWRHREGRVSFVDPRCSLASLTRARARYLPLALAGIGRDVAVWGAGKTGRALGREIKRNGLTPSVFVDIDPRKIGRRAHGAPIVGPERLAAEAFVIVAVGARGARDIVRRRLEGMGRLEGRDFLCAS